MADRSIRLAFPARPEYGRVARTAAAGLALRLGFTFPEIEDLRLAVDETLILLLRPDADASQVTLRFEPTDEGLVIDARADGDAAAAASDEAAGADAARGRFERLVTPIVETWTVDPGAHHVQLVKHRA